MVEPREDSDNWSDDGDEEVNEEIEEEEMEIELMCNGGNCQSVPSSNLLRIKVQHTFRL